MRTKATMLIKFNAYRRLLGKPPIKRWRTTRDRLEEACERLLDRVEKLRKQERGS